MESRMREIRQSGSKGRVAGNDHPYPYRVNGEHPTSPPCRPRALTRRSAPGTPGRGTRPTRVTGNTRRARLVGPRALTVRSLVCRARWGWPERLEPYRGGGSGT